MDLEATFARFLEAPPSIHGTYEYRSKVDPTLRYELWVDWPAFRLSLTSDEGGEPLVIATRDGELFGYRYPANGDVGVTRDLGEGVWVLGPILHFYGSPFGDPMFSCWPGHVLGVEPILGRPAIHVRCADRETGDIWVDQETGLILRETLKHPEPRESGWSGYVDIEFDPVLDRAMFDPRSV